MYCDHNSQYCLLPLSQEVQGLVTQKLLVLKKGDCLEQLSVMGRMLN